MARRINPFGPLLENVPAPLKNKYILTLIVFLFIVFFVNKISPWKQWKLQSAKEELKAKKEYYKAELEEVNLDKRDSDRDPEKFAREHYFMKKKGEDVFIIVEEDENSEKKK